MDNMTIYNKFRAVPQEAQKPISAGKLKNFTDINPMWRLKMLTEVFGPSGFGWYIEDEQHWTETIANEVAVFCKVSLRVKHPESGEWSMPIIGIGGSKLAGKGKGEGLDDEAYKMAYTDAISIACKALGMAADIYYAKDRTKYDVYGEPSAPQQTRQTQQAQPAKQKPMMHKNHENWQKMLQAVLEGKYTWQQLEAKYNFPEADLIEGKTWVIEHQQ